AARSRRARSASIGAPYRGPWAVPGAPSRSSWSRQRHQEVIVSRIIVIEFVSLDGVVHAPDGAEGSAHGGWAFRHGPQAVAGDKFRLGEVLNDGALLLGRRTWHRFAGIWPRRDDEFSRTMNAIPKLVVCTPRDD